MADSLTSSPAPAAPVSYSSDIDWHASATWAGYTVLTIGTDGSATTEDFATMDEVIEAIGH